MREACSSLAFLFMEVRCPILVTLVSSCWGNESFRRVVGAGLMANSPGEEV